MDLPTNRAHKLSMTTMSRQTITLVQITTEDGIQGIGEATTIGGLSYCDESPEGMKLAIETYIAPILMGRELAQVNELTDLIAKSVKGNRIAKSAIETALLDNYAKRLNVNIASLLGGKLNDTLPVLWVLASGNTQQDIEEALRYLDEGRHNRFKIKVGFNSLEKDIAHVSAIKQALGDRGKLSVDVNQAWSESQARIGIAKLLDAGVDLIEQPVALKNLDALSRLNQMFPVSIMADESVQTAEDIYQVAHQQAADVVALKIGKSGGPWQVLKSAHVANAAGLSLYGGTLLEGSVGTVASLQAFSTLQLEWGTELFGPLLLTDDIVQDRLKYQNFQVEIPNGPGLGIELDPDKVNFYKRK